MSTQQENPQQLITSLWLLINLTTIGFFFSAWVAASERISLPICIPATNPPVMNTSVPTASPTFRNGTRAPTFYYDAPTTSDNDTGDDFIYDDGNSGFVMVWSTFLLIALCVGGTMVLKSNRTPFAIGGFSGVVFLMANLMFMLSATSVGELRRRSRFGANTGADEALLAFSVMEFMLLSAFFVILVRNKDDVLELKATEEQQIVDPRTYETPRALGI